MNTVTAPCPICIPEHQFFGLAADGTLVWAGVHGLGRITFKAVRKRQRKWIAWREQYLQDNPGRYPLREPRQVTSLVVFPIGFPSRARQFPVA